MKISYNWLKEFINLKVSANKLADDLCLFGHEVEEVKKHNDDYILDIKFTANRGDCLSMIGISREIAAMYDLKIKNKSIDVKEINLNKKININISNNEICPRFSARIIEDVSVKESPAWIKNRLTSYGFRPINNIVDITNLVIIETGQPLHAFDYHKISDGVINVRIAKEGEYMITLDGKERSLDNNAIVIDDKKRIYDLAGIMGGFNSEIDEKTKTIILEGAIFNPILIRRTSKRLNHTTDASYRFERGVDIEGNIFAINYATHLINQSCHKSTNSRIYDIKNTKLTDQTINVTPNNINNLLGLNLNETDIKNILDKLNIKYHHNTATVPSYRVHDLKIWQAIAGEVARIYGYNNIPKNIIEPTIGKPNNYFIKKEFIKDILVSLGFNEIYSYSFADESLLKFLKINLSTCTEIVHSITPENKYLRPSLVSSLLTAVSKNPWAPEVNIFEIGKVFKNNKEYWELGVATTGKNSQPLQEVQKILQITLPTITADQQILNYLKIRKQVKYFTISLDDIKITANAYNDNFVDTTYKQVSQFPPTIRDLAFIVDKTIDPDHIIKEIYQISSEILIVELFDEFASDKLGINKKNIAFHVWIQDLSKSPEQKNVDKLCTKIIKDIESKYKAKLR